MNFEGYSAVIDLETGGFLKEQNPITEIGYIILDPDLREVERYSTLIKPYDSKMYIHADAARLTGITMDRCVNEGKPIDIVFNDLIDVARKYKRRYQKLIMIGHNFKFDHDFLTWNFNRLFGTGKNKISSLHDHFDETFECTMRIAHRKFGRKNELADFKLGTIAQHFGIENTASHSAMGDIEVTAEVYRRLNNIGGNSDINENKNKVNFQF